MGITKRVETEIGRISGPFKIIHIKESTIYMDNLVDESVVFNRRTINPLSDITNESQEVKDVCNIFHTLKVRDAYKIHISNK